jgi:dihydrofolate synthase/folylpolyglutamate synthase
VTSVGAKFFHDANCDVAVMEVGIGGRLDATNVLNTNLSVITAVQLDHTAILGNTVDEIAKEKCGIFRKDVDAIIGPGVPLVIAQVFS